MMVYLEVISIVSLMGAMVSAWSKYTYAWVFPISLFVFTGYISGWITPIAAVPAVVLALLVYYYHVATVNHHRVISTVVLVIFSILFATHNMPGFGTITFYEDVFISDKKGTSSLRFYADKPLIGFMLLLKHRDNLCNTFAEYYAAVKRIFAPLVLGIVAIYIIGYAIGFVRFDITIGILLIPWLFRNLFFTVIAEEMLLRGVVQDQLEHVFKSSLAPWIALAVASSLFGLVHLYAGWGLAVLATFAGVLYGYVYIHTRKIETAFLAHITLNVGTAALFYYPSVSNA